MVPLAFFSLLLAGGYALPDRIVGGQPTTIDRYPSIVAVESQGSLTGTWSQSCAANILTTEWVLSAAHCFDGLLYQPEYRRIRAGSSYRNMGGQVVGITRAYLHPTWGSLGNDGDITVVRLELRLAFNTMVRRGTIITPNYQVPDNTEVIHAGWGSTASGGNPSEVLQDVRVFTMNSEECRNIYANLPQPQLVTENMICAGVRYLGGRDTCEGDEGGPLYMSDVFRQLFIVGVVSWGNGCGNATFPGVSTKVSSYTNWIAATIY